jgi:hypothetical protein
MTEKSGSAAKIRMLAALIVFLARLGIAAANRARASGAKGACHKEIA